MLTPTYSRDGERSDLSLKLNNRCAFPQKGKLKATTFNVFSSPRAFEKLFEIPQNKCFSVMQTVRLSLCIPRRNGQEFAKLEVIASSVPLLSSKSVKS